MVILFSWPSAQGFSAGQNLKLVGLLTPPKKESYEGQCARIFTAAVCSKRWQHGLLSQVLLFIVQFQQHFNLISKIHINLVAV